MKKNAPLFTFTILSLCGSIIPHKDIPNDEIFHAQRIKTVKTLAFPLCTHETCIPNSVPDTVLWSCIHMCKVHNIL